MNSEIGGICPGIYIFRWCVVRNLQYYPLLFSQTLSLLGYLRSRCIFYVLICLSVHLSSPLTPIMSDPFSWPPTSVGSFLSGYTKVPINCSHLLWVPNQVMGWELATLFRSRSEFPTMLDKRGEYFLTLIALDEWFGERCRKLTTNSKIFAIYIVLIIGGSRIYPRNYFVVHGK